MARAMNSGWYVSQQEFMEKGYPDTTIYLFDVDADEWSVVRTQKIIDEKNLPVPAHEMWPVRLVQR